MASLVTSNAFVQRRPFCSEAEKRASGGGPLGPERTGTIGYVMDHCLAP